MNDKSPKVMAYYTSTSATIISIDRRNCGGCPPQLRWPWKKPQCGGLGKAATAGVAHRNCADEFSNIIRGFLASYFSIARFEADAVAFEASAVFEADAFFFTPLPAIFFLPLAPASC